MFEYTICTAPDEDVFHRQCAALERNIPGLKRDRALKDVDSSIIQIYHLGNNDIQVRNDNYLGCVWVKSEIDLEPFFQ